MNIITQNLNILSDTIKFFIGEKVAGRQILKKYFQSKNYYKSDWKERKILQRKKLNHLIHYCYENIPYYKKILFKSDLINKINKDISFFKDVPFLNKKLILENYDLLINQKKKEKIHYCKTGGSSGEKITVEYDNLAADNSSAVTRYCRNSIRVPGNDLHFAANFGDKIGFKDKLKENIKSYILGRDNVFFSSLNDEDVKKIIKKIFKKKPTLIHCHPSTMIMIYNYCSKEKIKFTFKYFESSGEQLTKIDRKKIENYFFCKVIQRYGQAETGIIAYEIFKDEKIYVLDKSVYVENYDDEIITTGLENLHMPLLRYQTGDLGKLKENFNGNYFDEIIGRKHEKLILNNKIYLTHHIQDIIDHRILNVNMFQVMLRENKKHLLLINVSHNHLKSEIINKVNKYFHNSFEVQFVEKDNFIFKGSRSKFNYIVNQ